MAVTITITKPHPDRWIVDIVETAVSDGETVTIQPEPTLKFPKAGRIMRISSVLSSGSASTVSPIVSSSTDFSGPQVAIEVAPGNPVDEAYLGGAQYGMVADKFYFRSNPNLGSDNAVSTRLLVQDGWGEQWGV